MDDIDKTLSMLMDEQRNFVAEKAQELMRELNRFAVERLWLQMMNETNEFMTSLFDDEGYQEDTESYMQGICYRMAIKKLHTEAEDAEAHKTYMDLTNKYGEVA